MKDSKELLKELNNIGIALSAERDVEKLLEIILEESMNITSSDGGSLYILEEYEDEMYLKFSVTRNKSRRFPFKEFLLPMNKESFAGYSAVTGETLNINNVLEIPSNLDLKYNSNFDKQIDYKTVNMLVIPMKNYNQEVVGVLQLLNKKKDADKKLEEIETIPNEIINYPKEEEEIISSLASQAAILLERTKLFDNIRSLLESFIETMVNTIDARDTTTSGHSRRLAGYAIEFAKKINQVDYGKYKDTVFSEEEIREIYYSALLHDVGKIGIRENILLKRNRLTDDRLNFIRYRFHFIEKDLIIKEKDEIITKAEKFLLDNINSYVDFIEDINRKGFITEEEEKKINEIAMHEYIDINNTRQHILDEFEVENLSVKRGNLTDEERYAMNYHATQSYDILRTVDWGKNLERVPEIAGSHHEKIDGSGYPKGLTEDEIPLQSKILALLDIFEALTARDRPYKPPMPVERSIQILEKEVELNHLDSDLMDIFKKEKIYELYQEELNRILKI